ncbi:hypothetical protein M422DRAFT_254101 [Sphaerobolus stellatus SS14]|uniref:Uncharacterized protein n=1 Tax=Sphaerobolus stellatus (strain SS14) TaxID=990650 RepID=A0A0C9UHU4_SPHS4|nr:hypothetical protein M422DRAFT_254101 [Sphaerobolus stellatus SS14]
MRRNTATIPVGGLCRVAGGSSVSFASSSQAHYQAQAQARSTTHPTTQPTTTTPYTYQDYARTTHMVNTIAPAPAPSQTKQAPTPTPHPGYPYMPYHMGYYPYGAYGQPLRATPTTKQGQAQAQQVSTTAQSQGQGQASNAASQAQSQAKQQRQVYAAHYAVYASNHALERLHQHLEHQRRLHQRHTHVYSH